MNAHSKHPAWGLRRCPHRKGAGFSLIEMIIVVAIILIIAAIAVPRLLKSKMAANEAAAVQGLRVITTAEVTYDTIYNQGYAPTLTSLGPPPPGSQASALHADLMDEVLASGIRHGYNFVYVPIDMAGNGKPSAFTVHANPVSPGQTGERYFFVDQTNVIRFAVGGPANSSSTPVPQ